jgi:hypothetical protein
MNINLKKLNTIIENKTNKAIDKLEEFKCTSEEYQSLLNAIFNNLEAVKKLQKFDTICLDCVEENKEPTKQNNGVLNPLPPSNSNSLIGKKWIPFE